MVNILGPGLTGDEATATRPTHQLTGSGSDLWFKDCSTEEAQDGTRIRAQWLNMMMAQLREAIRGMGVTDDEDDDTMLLQCFQSVVTDVSDWLNLPLYPETLTGGYTLSVSDLGGGSLRVNTGQSFIHRGWNKVSTNDYLDAARTVTTTASKTYHLRWQYNSGSPIFVLKDLADGVYNPGTLAETDASFDSTYDDMLIARVTTDGSNIATITLLANKQTLGHKSLQQGAPSGPYTGNSWKYEPAALTLNWARTPKSANVSGYLKFSIVYTGYLEGDGGGAFLQEDTRYTIKGAVTADYNAGFSGASGAAGVYLSAEA